MTARKGKSKSRVSDEMAHEVLIDAAPDDTAAAANEDQEDQGGSKPPRRPQEPQETKGFWGNVEQIARIAASIGVAGAAIVGVIEYISTNEDVRRERSLALVQDWQEDKHIERFTRLQSFVEAQLQTSTLPPASLPPEVLAAAYPNLGYTWMTALREQGGAQAQVIEADVDRLTLFFAQMSICISSDLCNADVLNAYFHSEATTFWQYFEGYAKLRREANYADYGRPVDALVAQFKQMAQP